MTELSSPWVLVRKGVPVVKFATLEGAKRFHDTPRFNGIKQPDAVIFGPGGEEWHCGGTSTAYWERDDGRRKREAAARREEAAARKEEEPAA